MADQDSVRVLVAATQEHLALWRRGAKMSSSPISLTEALDAQIARYAIEEAAPHVLIAEDLLHDLPKLIAAARASRQPPLIAVAKTYSQNDAELKADLMVPMPTTAEEAQQQIANCLRARHAMQVLIVDDSSTMRSIVRKVLGASRYPMRLSEAQDAAAAVAAIGGQRFDVVFMDYNMPDMNGLDAIALIREKQADARIVIISSTTDPGMDERARRAGASDFLKKPFFAADIDQIIERCVVSI
jgi:CheY-like chemotaxis protein